MFEYTWLIEVLMSFWLAILLGLIQGLTEFLPVSSSGHLTFFEIAFGLKQGNILFNVLLHVATLLALIIYFRKQIWDLLTHPLSAYVRMLLLSSIITAVVGILVDQLIGAEGSLLMIAIGFVITAILLVCVNYFIKSKKYLAENFSYKHAIIVGFVQGIAVLPGLSRSGSTLAAGVLSGADKNQSAQFSFLLSIPIIFASTAYEIYKGAKTGFSVASSDILPVIVGCVVAFVVALLSLKAMMKLVSKNKWLWFAGYLIIAAIAILLSLNF